ncbi:hypothetical protein [Syntrophomonas wolfei]|jgi:hypothetical protein|uniref:hypothetical protein n=1 Tax=Syntrophomonas wolfei TaxID=863 RepID=UPI0023F4292E|nr:hypothetical protein [Syntrophomonas wolfei]
MFPTAEFRNKERAEYIEKQKHRQELKRQEEERAAAARKAAERTPYEKILDKQETLKQLVNGIQGGDPRNEGFIIDSIKQICDILDLCLNECKPKINRGDRQPEE